jgi:hypothetical protein
MFDTSMPASADCVFAVAARLTGPALLGLAVVALEAWLRLPLRPLVDFYLPKLQAGVETWVRRLPF